MPGPLALVGGCEWSEGCDFDGELLEASGGAEVVVLATAAAFERPERAVARAAEHFAQWGGKVVAPEVYRRADATSAQHAGRLAAARFVYLAGGSPMHLRSVLKDAPVWDAVVRAWREGAVLAGSAEGATVLSTHMVDSRGGAFTVGLDLLAGLTVIPHYDEWSEDKWHRTIRLAPAGMVVVGIEQRTALIAGADGWRAAGAGSVDAYRGGRRIELADLPPLDDLVTSR